MGEQSIVEAGILHQAYWVRKNKGTDAYNRFIDKHNLPTEDIERVNNKYLYQTDPAFRARIDKMVGRIKDKLKRFGSTNKKPTKPTSLASSRKQEMELPF